MKPVHAFALVALACAACAAEKEPAGGAPPTTDSGCIAGGGGYLNAQLRGAVVADLDWANADMQCDGGPRPDGAGLRVTLAGPLADDADGPARRLRFIFGIDPEDSAAGAALALPTNLTVIIEGEAEIYATRGDGRCAVETFERAPLAGSGGQLLRVHARGYCVSPAASVAGEANLLVPTFEFTGIANAQETP